MGNYSGAINWVDDVYQFDDTDPVQGGPDGIDNKPLKDLADRTQWLKSKLGLITNLAGELVLNGSGNVNLATDIAGKLVTVWATGIYNLFLPDAAQLPYGAIVPFSNFCNAGAVTNVVSPNGQPIYDSEGVVNVLHLHHKEHLFLVAYTNHYKVLFGSPGIYQAGEEIKARKQRNNTLILNGQILQRAQYPRLWAYAQTLTMYNEIVPEYYFFYDNITYRGFFTDGDGATTFRVPDERGLSERMLDLGRGIDNYRALPYAGAYEADRVGPISITTNRRSTKRGGGSDPSGEAWASPAGATLGNNFDDTITGGSTESIVKNIGKLNLIKF